LTKAQGSAPLAPAGARHLGAVAGALARAAGERPRGSTAGALRRRSGLGMFGGDQASEALERVLLESAHRRCAE
jgi:hypothetical protein